MLNPNPLLDEEFLVTLYSHRNRKTYARIIALSFAEEPLEQIEGCITQGSINVDGSSAIRRTCSLSMVAKDLNINDYYWGLKSKFKLEIGIENTIKNMPQNNGTNVTWGEKYPQDIIWFPQGIYAITTFNTTYNTNNYNISISGKDKMCFLNGDLGGSLTASIDFGVEEYYDKENNITTYTPIPLKTIIKEAVHTYALEPYHNIIVNDMDEIAVELLEYRGDIPLYLLYDVNVNGFTNFTLNSKMSCVDANNNTEYSSLDDSRIIYDPRVDLSGVTNITPTRVKFNGSNTEYTIAKVEYGQSVGYRLTELTYAGELISKVGESICSILDKIKKMLGEYEYYYDIDGHFVFQRKKTYIQSSWNNILKVGDEQYADNIAYTSSAVYHFTGNNLITSFSNSPNLANLRNDFSVWGERTGVSGVKLPIHYRYAIDIKPTRYVSIGDAAIEYTSDKYDWREIIYQMAVDHHANSQYDWYVNKLIERNPLTCSNGTTGYEQYYTDLLGFWRDLYKEDGNWTEKITTAPDQLDFWFDFLDANSELGQFSVKAIGDRVKAVNDTSVTAIYFREVPDLIFTTRNEASNSDLVNQSGYTPVFMTGALENMFNISSQGKSAQDLIDELVYNHSYCVESVTVQSIPIYHLNPNVRISIQDEKSNIDGEYIVSKLTIPLAYDGIMSITATKAPERLI